MAGAGAGAWRKATGACAFESAIVDTRVVHRLGQDGSAQNAAGNIEKHFVERASCERAYMGVFFFSLQILHHVSFVLVRKLYTLLKLHCE